MKHLLFLGALATACASAVAADERMQLVHPKGGNLTLVQLERETGSSAKFSGQIWVSGTFVAQWPGGVKTKVKAPEYLLVPDKQSKAVLPYFVLKEPPYFNRYPVDVIDLENGEAALRMTVSGEKVDQLLNHKTRVVRATGRFLVESYIVGVECDAFWARAVLVRTQLPSQLAIVHQRVPERC